MRLLFARYERIVVLKQKKSQLFRPFFLTRICVYGILTKMRLVCSVKRRTYHYNFTRMENESWKELRLLKLVTFAKAQRTVAVANARHPVSPLVRLAVVLLISSVKTQRNKSL